MRGRVRRQGALLGGAVGVALLVWLVAGVPVASAHATLVRTDPADGGTGETPPDRIVLVFSEAVDPLLATVSLVDTAGRAFPGVVIDADAGDPSSLVVRLPDLSAGAYRLAWQVVDDVDLHVTSGSVVFGVAQAAPAPSPTRGADPSLVEVLLRWVGTTGTALAVGALLLLVAAIPRPAPEPSGDGGGGQSGPVATLRRRLFTITALAAAFSLVTGATLVLVQVIRAADAGIAWRQVLTTGHATASLAALLVMVVVLGAAIAGMVALAQPMTRDGPWRLLVRPGPGPFAAVALIALIAIAVLQAAAGHAASSEDVERPVRTAALAAHLIAAWSWLGGLAVLVVAVLPLLRHQEDAPLARSVLLQFWRIAVPALAVLAVTGLYLGGQLVASVDALLLTLYGQALIVKIGLFAAAAWLGLRNSASLHPRVAAVVGPFVRRSPGRGSARSGRGVALETVGALAVVLAAAVMASSPPARLPATGEQAAAARQPDVTLSTADLVVTLSLRPGQPGPNFLDLAVMDTRRPAPGPIESVAVRLVSPTGRAGQAIDAHRLEPGRYQLANDSIQVAGTWRIGVTVRRAGMADAAVDLPWTVAAPVLLTDRPVVISDQPLAPYATPVAGAVAILLLTIAAVVVVRWVALRRTAGQYRLRVVSSTTEGEVLR